MRLNSTALCALLALAASPGHARRSIEELVASKDALVRESAVQILGARGSTASIPLLVERLQKDNNLWVRSRAAEALGRLGAPAAIRPLRSALAREKQQRVRRMIAVALVRLGQRAGVEDLMWQLKSGTNHTKAEVMALWVDLFGRPLGQDPKAWWAYLSREGQTLLARRPAGDPALLELRTARLFASKVTPWQVLPAVVITLKPTGRPVTPRELRAFERKQGRIPDGCLLLIRTRWREAKPQPKNERALISGPGLTLAAAQHLLQRAPKLAGVGIDAPALDATTAAGTPNAARDLLVSKGRLALVGVEGMDLLLASGTRVLLVDTGEATAGARKVRALALMP
jgi:hypothetical protein